MRAMGIETVSSDGHLTTAKQKCSCQTVMTRVRSSNTLM